MSHVLCSRKSPPLVFGILVSVMWLLGGCATEMPQDTPHELLEKWRSAILRNDEDALLACCVPKDDGWPDTVRAWLAQIQANNEFKRTLLETHGSDAWETLEKRAETVGGMWPKPLDEDIVDMSTAQITIAPDGNSAVVKVEWTGISLDLVRRNGLWYYDFSSNAIRFDPEEARDVMKRYEKGVRTVTDEMKASKLSYEKILRRLYEEY